MPSETPAGTLGKVDITTKATAQRAKERRPFCLPRPRQSSPRTSFRGQIPASPPAHRQHRSLLLTSAQGLLSATKNRCMCWPSTASSSFSSDPSAIRLRSAATTAVGCRECGTRTSDTADVLANPQRPFSRPPYRSGAPQLLHALSAWLQVVSLTSTRPLPLSKRVQAVQRVEFRAVKPKGAPQAKRQVC